MNPSDCVIAHAAGADIGAYTITSYDSSTIVSTTAFSLGSPTYSASAATFSRTVGTGSKVTLVNVSPILPPPPISPLAAPPLLLLPPKQLLPRISPARWARVASFSRTVGTGSKVTFVNGPMKTIWAYSDGPSTSLDGHGGNRGSTTIDFSCDGTPVATPSPPPASANPSPPPPPAASASPPPPAASASPPPPTATPSPPPAPPAAGVACPASSLEGFEYQVELGGPLEVVRPAAGVACPASGLEGFEYQVELGGPLMLLHWTFSTSTTIKFSIEARGATIAKDGWIAVGWSGNKGKMKGSDAVIGNLPGVAPVHMSGYSKKLIKQTSAFTIGDTAVATTSEGGTTITFTREVGKGAVLIKLNATNYLIYAFSTTASKTLAFHGWNQGGLAVDFACFKKPTALWGGGPDYSDDSDYSFNSARAASMDGTAGTEGASSDPFPSLSPLPSPLTPLRGGLAVDFSCFRKPTALWGGGPDYSDDSDYDNSFNSARAASMDGTAGTAGTSPDPATGGALSSGRRNWLHQQTGLGHQHRESAAAGTTAGAADGADGAVGTGTSLTNADWWAKKSAFWKAIFGG
ncbi:unnamed protein product [Closterium sp. Naga37s-1]|nr:unnamed protein product [Closterium sp. Naga37s-1]